MAEFVFEKYNMVMKKNNIQSGESDSPISNNNKVSQNEMVLEEWEAAAKEAHKNRDDKLMMDFPNEFDKDEWIW
jgi:hypothetical protein